MRGHVAKKGNNYYAVVYEGIDPATGKERHRWHAAGRRRIDAERLVNELVKRRHNGEETTSDRSTLAAYLDGAVAPAATVTAATPHLRVVPQRRSNCTSCPASVG